MGNAISSKDLSEQKLIIKNRFLQKQIQNNTEVDAATKHAILSVKKTRTYTNLVFSGGSTKGLSYNFSLKIELIFTFLLFMLIK